MNNSRFIGQSFSRKEDARLVKGQGKYVGDIQLPHALQVAFARSTEPHALIVQINCQQAQLLPGVIAVLTAQDLEGVLSDLPGLQNVPPQSWRDLVEHEISIPNQSLLAKDRVRYVGEPFAIVVAENRYIAEDAIELIQIDYEILPLVLDPLASTKPDSPKIHDSIKTNVVAKFRVHKGDLNALEVLRANKIRHRFRNHRFTSAPMENRGVAAEYNASRDTMTVWSSTQVVHWVRREVAKQLQMPEVRVHAIAPDVGGGFGLKAHVYPEEILIPFLARKLKKPVVWIEDRQENLLNSTHSRDDVHDAEIFFDNQGKILGLRDSFIKDSGAYTPVGVGAPSSTVTHICSLYHIPNLDIIATVVLTNKTPNAPYRGNGRPEAVFVIERLFEIIACTLRLEPVEVRRRNMIRADEMPYSVGIPYRDGVPITYDSGDYPKAFEAALDAIGGVSAFRELQQKALNENRYIGLGIGNYLEGTGAGPFEGATIRIDTDGSIVVATGACSQGQGHETVFAQVAADEWGVTPSEVTLLIGDTDAINYGWGTMASRSAVNSSGAIRLASHTLRIKVFKIAAHLLECSSEDLELRGGSVCVKGASNHAITFRELARAAQPGWHNKRPPGVTGGLEATEYFEPETVTWAYGCHLGIIEVNPKTGAISLLKYVVTHDAGVLINPMIVNGQILGGICQGIGGCLLEKIVYDEYGQNLSATFVDYLLPVATQMPEVEIIHFESPSPLNELGIKGLGEGGVVGPPAVIINGVCDALKPLKFQIFDSFVSQSDIVAAFNVGKK